MLAILAAIAFLIVSLLILLEISNNGDSIVNNEGKDRALINLAMLATILTITTYIAIAFLFPALVINNAEYLSAIIVAGVGVVFAYGVYCLVDLAMDFLLPINPSNPYAKFTMTADEANKLEVEKSIDSLKARAAIVMLNSEISSSSSLKMKSIFVDENIKTIRKIRSGEIEEIKFGSITIDLKKDPEQAEAYVVEHCPFVEVFPCNDNSSFLPSAPELPNA